MPLTNIVDAMATRKLGMCSLEGGVGENADQSKGGIGQRGRPKRASTDCKISAESNKYSRLRPGLVGFEGL